VMADSESLRIATPNLTLEAWIKDWTDQGLTNIFSKGYYDDRSVNYAFGIGMTGSEEFAVYITFSSNGDTYGWYAFPDSVPSGNKWLHATVALDSDAKEARFYLNGERISRVEGPDEYPESIILPAYQPAALTARYTRKIDELRLSDIPRYTEDFDPPLRHEPDEHTRGLWHFDEGDGLTVIDNSGNGNDGSLDEAGVTWTDTAVWRNWTCVSGWMSCGDATTVNSCNANGRWVEEEICSGEQVCETIDPTEAVCQ